MFKNLPVEVQRTIITVREGLHSLSGVKMSQEQAMYLKQTFSRPIGVLYSRVGLKVKETTAHRDARRKR